MKQKGLCPICGKSLVNVKSVNVVIDHSHETGIIRAALHRGCNQLEGKVKRFLGFAKCESDLERIKCLERLAAFYKLHRKPQTNLIYYLHKTDEEKRLLKNKRARLARARKKK